MGIKNLSKILKDYDIQPDIIHLSELKNKIFGIDANNFVHIFNHSPKYKTILEGFLKQILFLLKFNITPVYIFDGDTHKLKEDETNQRKETLKNNVKRYEDELINCIDEKQRKKLLTKIKNANNINFETFQNIKLLLDVFNIKHITSQEEADDICKELNKQQIIDFSYSRDKDFLLNNKYTIDFINIYKQTVQVWDRDNILKSLNISMDSFIDLSILLGCDYCSTIPKIGCKGSLKYILQYNNIENIIDNIDTKKYIITDFNYLPARKRFNMNFEYILETINSRFQLYINDFDIPDIVFFLKKYNLYDTKIHKEIQDVTNNYTNNINNSFLKFFI